jgi:hypothetical protein
MNEAQQIREFTDKAESGVDISDPLNGISFAERAKIGHAIAELNEQDLAAGKSVPALTITFANENGTDGNAGPEHLTGIAYDKDPNAWFFKGHTQVYDLPKEAEAAGRKAEHAMTASGVCALGASVSTVRLVKALKEDAKLSADLEHH